MQMAFDFTAQSQSAHFTLAGPFKSNGPDTLPSLDWQVHLAAAGRSIDGELISTGDDAFIKYGGQTYEAGKAAISKLMRQARQKQGSLQAADIQQLTRKMQNWFPKSSTQQDAQLDGEPVTRVTGRLDLSKALKDISQMTQGGPGITQRDLSQVDKQVTDPRFTVDVGKSDGQLRRVLATMRIRGQGAMRFLIRYRDINKPVTINAPSSGLPLTQLGKKLQQDFGGSSSSSGSASAS
jgi:polyhydroxyalkanoate synthesis regulator phasin